MLRKLGSGFLLLTMALVPCSVARGFVPAAPTGVISGAEVSYASTQWGDAIAVGNGTIFTFGAAHTVLAQLMYTTGAFANAVFDTEAGAQKALNAYYVYEMVYPGNNSPVGVISTIAPVPEGYPFSALTFIPHGGKQQTVQSGVFVGSYITDTKGSIIPFMRTGDDVRLAPFGSGATQSDLVTNSVKWSHQPGYPLQLGILVHFDQPGNFFFPIPITSRSLLVHAVVDTDERSVVVNIQDPDTAYLGGGGPNCNISAQYRIRAGTDVPGGTHHEFYGRVNDFIGNLFAVVCAEPAAGKSTTLTVSYEGYVESIHHLFSW
jgi:hypothetical protein